MHIASGLGLHNEVGVLTVAKDVLSINKVPTIFT